MKSSISILLGQFIDLYERRPEALRIALDQTSPFEDDCVPLAEQLTLLAGATRSAQEEIRRKTLIETNLYPSSRHSQLKQELQELINPPGRPNAQMLNLLLNDPPRVEGRMRRDQELEMRGLTELEWEQQGVRDLLAAQKLSTELLWFFAARIDEVTDAIEKLDDTDFTKLIPDRLRQPFRECHINFVLGNLGTSSILCGAIVERALQDLLPSDELLQKLIVEAKKSGLLNGHNRLLADFIHQWRNDVVHGRRDFSSITSDDAWELVTKTRTLVVDLYRERLHEKNG